MACAMSSYYDVESPSKSFGRGQVQVIFGPMFSGKTTELIRRLKRYQVSNHRCLIVKYAKDTRYDETDISTHDRQTLTAVSATSLAPLSTIAASHYSVIGIDEGQFFPDCVPFAEEMANLGKIVVVAALDATFQRQAFGDILHLVPLAESVVKLNAVCMQCFRAASYTKRRGAETEVEIIGGQEKYMAVCRKCYFDAPPSDDVNVAASVNPAKKALFSGSGDVPNGSENVQNGTHGLPNGTENVPNDSENVQNGTHGPPNGSENVPNDSDNAL